MDRNSTETPPITPVAHQQRPYAAPASNGSGKRMPSKKALIASLIGLVLIAAVVFGLMRFGPFGGLAKNDKYQAVFLTNGQVYFGKLSEKGTKYISLKDVYYLQATENIQSGEEEKPEDQANQSTQQLIKLGNEIHGPEDEMLISRDQILFFENIKDDGTVGKAIKSDKEKKN